MFVWGWFGARAPSLFLFREHYSVVSKHVMKSKFLGMKMISSYLELQKHFCQQCFTIIKSLLCFLKFKQDHLQLGCLSKQYVTLCTYAQSSGHLTGTTGSKNVPRAFMIQIRVILSLEKLDQIRQLHWLLPRRLPRCGPLSVLSAFTAVGSWVCTTHFGASPLQHMNTNRKCSCHPVVPQNKRFCHEDTSNHKSPGFLIHLP